MQSEPTQADPVSPGPSTPSGPPPRTRRARRWWIRGFAAGLVLLVALGVVGDLVLTRFVKDGVVRVMRCVTRNDAINPAVSLGGPPILLDLANRKLDRVTISGLSPAEMDQWLSSGSSLAGLGQGDLTITLNELGVSDPPSVQSAEAAVQLPWNGLSTTLASSSVASDTLTGATLGAEDGLLALTLRRKVGGQPLKVLASLKPAGGAMTVTPESIVVGGRKIGVGLVSLFAGDLLKDKNGESELKPRTIDLGLPDGVTVQALKVQANGLLVDLDIDPALVREQGRVGRDCRA